MVADMNVNVVRRDEQPFEKIAFDVPRHGQQIFVMMFDSPKVFGHAAHINDPQKVSEQGDDPVNDQPNPKMKNDTRNYHSQIKSKPRVLKSVRDFRRVVDLAEILNRVKSDPVLQRDEDHIETGFRICEQLVLLALPVGIVRFIDVPMMGPVCLPKSIYRHHYRPSSEHFPNPLVPLAIGEQTVMHRFVHQNSKRVLPGSNPHDRQNIENGIPISMTDEHGRRNPEPLYRDL
jgi:hypothetical protein